MVAKTSKTFKDWLLKPCHFSLLTMACIALAFDKRPAKLL